MYSSYKRQRILHFALMGHKAPTICRLLREGGLRTSRGGIHKFLQKYKETRSIERRPTKMTPAVKALVERQIREDDETTAIQPHALLRNGHTMTLKTVLRCRVDLFHSFYSRSKRFQCRQQEHTLVHKVAMFQHDQTNSFRVTNGNIPTVFADFL